MGVNITIGFWLSCVIGQASQGIQPESERSRVRFLETSILENRAYLTLTLTQNIDLTLTLEYGSALNCVNLLVSFSAWAELVWRHRLEVTNKVK